VIALAGYLTQADASRPILPALLNAYRQQGPQFVAQLRGAFVLAIQDRQQLHLARDGAGLSPTGSAGCRGPVSDLQFHTWRRHHAGSSI
jgi:hypothetical protein